MPPWAKAATRWSGCAAAIRVMARRDPGGEDVGRLGVRDDVPALLGDHAHGDRVALGDALAEHAPLPVAQEDLVEVRVDDHRQLEGARQRAGRLRRPTELRDVDRVDAFPGQSGAHLHRLLTPLGRERRIAVAIHELERLPLDRGLGLAVADEQHLGGAGRREEAVLAERAGFRHERRA